MCDSLSDAESTAERREFDLILFDWDGTAVPDRTTPVPRLIEALENTLRAKITCIVVTGTHVQNLMVQGLDRLTVDAKRSLYLCTNRGSEIWGFASDGSLELRHRRNPSPSENEALDRSARNFQAYAASFGLATEVISQRLNRRKIDLIPVSEWADPKKSEFRELLDAVTYRLGLLDRSPTGPLMKREARKLTLSDLLERAREIALNQGLVAPRVTSDIKHIEIGLTDKSDSVRWVYHNLILPMRVPITRVAILGDEFGQIGGIQGSDSFLGIPELQGAVFLSVGVEPGGAPPWVHHIGGGPGRFIEFLREQVRLRGASKRGTVEPEEEDLTWKVIQEGFEPSREREMESLFAIGNGYLGIRATSDFPVPAAQPDLFIAGVYDRKAEGLPYSEMEFLTQGNRTSQEAELVPHPSPFVFQVRLAEAPLSSLSGEMKAHARKLNLQHGLYEEEHLFEDKLERRTRFRSARWASLHSKNLLFQRIHVTSENYSAQIELELPDLLPEQSALYPHLETLASRLPQDNTHVVLYRTRGSKMCSAVASRGFINGTETSLRRLQVDLSPGQEVRIDRVISISAFDSPERAEQCARAAISGFSPDTWDAQFGAHREAWDRFWSRADIAFDGNDEAKQAQRFNLYHLRIAASEDPKISIPAKGLTGRAYEGHVFWDTEIFMFLFYLYTEPELAKSILLYRYRTLSGAKERARKLGFQGACYAWESTLSGRDVTPNSILVSADPGGSPEEIPIFTGVQQIHVTADVAYAVWKYWDATLDASFLADYGLEILVETARFWVSRISMREGIGHIVDVVGPDEYHHGVQDNAYTNWMAKLNLDQTASLCGFLRENHPDSFQKLLSTIDLKEREIAHWKSVAASLYVPQPDKDGVIEQFSGFHQLKTIQIPEHERHRAPVSRLFKWKEINGTKIIKQADVLMLPFLFPNAFPDSVIAANYRYYEPMTDHGSSLSPSVHAAIAARIGHWQEAKRYWQKALFLDLENLMSNTGLGIHAAAMGGAWQTLVFHMLGVKFSTAGPSLSSSEYASESLARVLGSSDLQMNLTYRGKRYPLRAGGRKRSAA